MPNRLCDVFLQRRGALLSSYGYESDGAQLERTAAGGFVFYHYTRAERWPQIEAAGGLYARLPVVSATHIPELRGCYLIDGLLEPWPAWITNSRYFDDFVARMMQRYVGNLLLRITLPPGFPGVFVAEMAHSFDCKYQVEHGHSPLNLGYDCRTGQEVTVAEANSYVPIEAYVGGHVLPNIKATRHGEGVAIPWECIALCESQPLHPGQS